VIAFMVMTVTSFRRAMVKWNYDSHHNYLYVSLHLCIMIASHCIPCCECYHRTYKWIMLSGEWGCSVFTVVIHYGEYRYDCQHNWRPLVGFTITHPIVELYREWRSQLRSQLPQSWMPSLNIIAIVWLVIVTVIVCTIIIHVIIEGKCEGIHNTIQVWHLSCAVPKAATITITIACVPTGDTLRGCIKRTKQYN
jgi:hypothetical protein